MGSARKLLDWFDPVFADSFTCFLPPPYDTANEVNDKLKEVFDKLDKEPDDGNVQRDFGE
jgi:hypothetical protein